MNRLYHTLRGNTTNGWVIQEKSARQRTRRAETLTDFPQTRSATVLWRMAGKDLLMSYR